MAEKMRYNKIIDLLEHGKPVFSTSTVPNGSLDDLTYIADADYDAVIIEMEHEGFSFTTLRTSLQVLLNRKRIAEKGNLQPDVVPCHVGCLSALINALIIKQVPPVAPNLFEFATLKRHSTPQSAGFRVYPRAWELASFPPSGLPGRHLTSWGAAQQSNPR